MVRLRLVDVFTLEATLAAAGRLTDLRSSWSCRRPARSRAPARRRGPGARGRRSHVERVAAKSLSARSSTLRRTRARPSLTALDADIITHIGTLEQKTLPGAHRWQLTFVNGFGAASSETSDEVLLLETWLDKQVYVNESSGSVILPDGASSISAATSLMQWQRRSEYTTTWSSSSLFGDFSMPFFRLSYPRQGSTWFVDAACFYKLLSMTSFTGQASKRVFKSTGRWASMLQKYGMLEHVVKSSAGVSAHEPPDAERFLPRLAVSLRAAFGLRWRWSSRDANDGGLRNEEGRAKALSLAMAMVDGVVSTEIPEKIDITIDFNLDWKVRWPRPQIMKDPMRLHRSPGGHLDITEWRDIVEAAEIPRNDVKRKWYSCLRGLDVGSGSVSICELFLQQEFFSKDFSAFYGQLLCALGERGERVLTKSLSSKSDSWPLRASRVERSNDARLVDQELSVYIDATKRATLGQQHISLAVDKAVVKGLSLQNGVLALPTNLAFFLTPGGRSAPEMASEMTSPTPCLTGLRL